MGNYFLLMMCCESVMFSAKRQFYAIIPISHTNGWNLIRSTKLHLCTECAFLQNTYCICATVRSRHNCLRLAPKFIRSVVAVSMKSFCCDVLIFLTVVKLLFQVQITMIKLNKKQTQIWDTLIFCFHFVLCL